VVTLGVESQQRVHSAVIAGASESRVDRHALPGAQSSVPQLQHSLVNVAVHVQNCSPVDRRILTRFVFTAKIAHVRSAGRPGNCTPTKTAASM